MNAAPANAPDRPRVIAPPPLIATVAVVLGLYLDRTLPAYVLATMLTLNERLVVGALIAFAGGVLAVAAERQFRAVGTNVPPWKPTLRIATEGVYSRMRNPMYIGLLLLVGGIGVALASDWTLVLLVPTAIVLHYGVVLREERYLEAKFGDTYRRYRDKVPRWGLW
jgi:protein-S-isoprenylcysteine O-methyltransferase Ste14